MFKNSKALKIRREKKLNSGYVANALNISTSTLWSWEKGRRNPSEKSIRQLAQILNVAVSEISDLKENINLTGIPGVSTQVQKITDIFAQNKELSLINQSKNALNQINNITNELGRISSLFKAVLKHLDMIFYVKDVNQKFVIANKSFLKHLSLNESFNVIGKEDKDFFSAEEAKHLIAEDKKLLTTEKPIIHRQGYIPGSRKKKIGQFSKFPFYDSFGNLAGIICIIDDITKEYREAQFRKLLENTLNNCNDVIFLRKASGSRKYIYISDTVKNMYGYTKEEFFNDILLWETKCIHPEDREIAITFSETCMLSELKKYRIISRGGLVHNIEANVLCNEINGEKYICAIEREVERKTAD